MIAMGFMNVNNFFKLRCSLSCTNLDCKLKIASTCQHFQSHHDYVSLYNYLGCAGFRISLVIVMRQGICDCMFTAINSAAAHSLQIKMCLNHMLLNSRRPHCLTFATYFTLLKLSRVCPIRPSSSQL